MICYDSIFCVQFGFVTLNPNFFKFIHLWSVLTYVGWTTMVLRDSDDLYHDLEKGKVQYMLQAWVTSYSCQWDQCLRLLKMLTENRPTCVTLFETLDN